MSPTPVRARELQPGDRIAVDERPGEWVVESAGKELNLVIDFRLVEVFTRELLQLRVFGDQLIDRID